MSSKRVAAIIKYSLGYPNVELQENGIRDRISSLLPDHHVEIYREDSTEASTVDEFLQRMERSGVSYVAVWNLLALSPVINSSDDLLTLLSGLEEQNIKLIFAETGRMLLNGLTSLVEVKNIWDGFRVARKRKNALASIQKAAMRGAPMKRRRKSDPELVLARRAEGYSPSEIAVEFGISVSSVQKTLRAAH